MSARGIAVTVVPLLAAEGIVDVAIAFLPGAGEAPGQVVGDRPGDGPTDLPEAEVADAHRDMPAKLLLGLRRAHADNAGGGIAPEQCALGTPHHLDRFEVDEIAECGTGSSAVDIVDEYPHGLFKPGVLARSSDAADR